ncbi:MAG: 3-isopropylmalate dehydratase large subunit [Firmicutes bacterium]|nr:3-isopropylmalate dehydratase large subunit [Bacillota bacterium]
MVFIADHFTPNASIKAAEQCKIIRQFAKRFDIKNFFDTGRAGIEHCLLPEQGFVMPGDLILGADSHTCTYGALGAFSTGIGSTDLAVAMKQGEVWMRVPETIKVQLTGNGFQDWVSGKDIILFLISKIGVEGARYKVLEFDGDALPYLSIDNRFTIANMTIEAGAKAGIFKVDQITMDYVNARKKKDYKVFYSDKGANYCDIINININEVPLYVARPHSPDNGVPIDEVPEVILDQVVIGSCTNGREEDLSIAAKILKRKKIAKNLRLIVLPGTQEIYLKCLRNGVIETLIEAGAAVSTPTCGPCVGAHMGILGSGEKVLATTNRNFAGRMGHPTSEIYLSNPAVAAASAIAGKIINPREVM